ncbi:UDP-N-acetyl glucosamine 2-epimerase [Campylobacter sp. LR291e]|nr:UDP-N-acetyl glucosamine 2-epimerase [Campylobacter sp. LR291e]
MKYAKLIITDNGDIQEEGTSFKVPILVARYTTERMGGIKMKCAKLVGADEKNIFKEASKILKQNKKATRVSVKNPYEDGKASKKIIKYIREFFKNERFN